MPRYLPDATPDEIAALELAQERIRKALISKHSNGLAEEPVLASTDIYRETKRRDTRVPTDYVSGEMIKAAIANNAAISLNSTTKKSNSLSTPADYEDSPSISSNSSSVYDDEHSMTSTPNPANAGAASPMGGRAGAGAGGGGGGGAGAADADWSAASRTNGGVVNIGWKLATRREDLIEVSDDEAEDRSTAVGLADFNASAGKAADADAEEDGHKATQTQTQTAVSSNGVIISAYSQRTAAAALARTKATSASSGDGKDGKDAKGGAPSSGAKQMGGSVMGRLAQFNSLAANVSEEKKELKKKKPDNRQQCAQPGDCTIS